MQSNTEDRQTSLAPKRIPLHPSKLTSILRLCLPSSLLLAIAASTTAQTLARPGWNASGFNADPWWRRAVFYRIKAAPNPSFDVGNPQTDWITDSKTIVTRLDFLQSLGVDALILPLPAPPKPDASLDNVDELIRQASSRGIHVLPTISAALVTADLSATARFWLSRGVSGFHVVTPPQTSAQDMQAIVQAVRKITSNAVGGRIVISDMPQIATTESSTATSPHPRIRRKAGGAKTAGDSANSTDAQLHINSHLSLPEWPGAASLRALLSQSQLDTDAIVDIQPPTPTPGSLDPYPALAKAMAAIALTLHPAALIDAGQDLLQPSRSTESTLTDWYRQLIALHHGNATLRSGSVTMLDFDAQNALVWVSRPASNARLAAPVVVACNLTSSPLQLSLTAAMKGLNLHGFYLRTLLRTDKAMGAQDLNAVTMPPFGVYIGELHR